MKELKASATFDGLTLVIANEDGFDWKNCDFTLNLQVFGTDYHYHQRAIGAGHHKKVDVTEFTDGSGERFNPVTRKLNAVSISCDTDTGKRFYSGTFGTE